MERGAYLLRHGVVAVHPRIIGDGTYDEDGTPNAMNAAWGGIMGEDKVSICILSDAVSWMRPLDLHSSSGGPCAQG